MAQISFHGREKKPSKTNVNICIFWLAAFFFFYLIYTWLEDIPEIPPLPDPNGLTTAHSASDSVRPEDILNTPETYLYPRSCTQQNATIADLAKCYPEAPLQQPWLYHHGKEGCAATPAKVTWPFLRDCISGQRTTHQKLTQIHVIGERNSGTKWLQQELEKCFPRSHGVRSHRDFLRSKHFFQPPSRGNFETSLVVAIVRDPLEWVAAMREKPYHMPQHTNGFDTSTKQMPAIPLEWEDFIRRPWKMTQLTPDDWHIIQTHQTETIRCSQGFAFDEVSPCYFDNSTLPRAKWRGHVPIYELRRDHSGQAFADLLKLRSDKAINFFLEVPLLMHLGGFLAVRYDDLVQEGTRSFMEKVAALLGMPRLPSHCHPQGPHPERLGQRTIPPAFRKWIEERLVLETEQMLGFR